jgi:Ankyrin repeats (3 copies)
LMEGKQRKRVPLWYVAVNELRTTNGNELSEELRFMLLQTHQALLRYEPVDQEVSQQSNDSYRNVPTDHYSLKDENDGGCMLQATIACTHLLGKYAPRLTATLLKNNLYRRERLFEPDEEGNLMLHHACMATAQRFERNLKFDDTQVDLIQHLIELNAASLNHYNAWGELPLHLAIQTGKDWGHINTLLRANPDSVKECNARGELPLHLAIKFGHKRFAKALWKQYPQSAAIADGSTRLYPFQLVACHNQRAAPEISDCTTHERVPVGNNVEATRTASADLIYFFLRESPQVLKHCTR